jgi:hypothetical protein|tara:strand:- start:723 stop:1136 length:414 start_codon:yes stop_codon:yes gene_type:complete
MIKYLLKCNKNHEFESWFSTSNEFEKLKNKNFIECIFCKSRKIEKTIMSPLIIKKEKNYDSNLKEISKIKKDLLKVRRFVEKNFEFVGDKLSNEVRSIYYDKKKQRNIYGTVTQEENQELKEEGIELDSIPWLDKEN